MARLVPSFDAWRRAEDAVRLAQQRLLSALVARDWPAVHAHQAEVQARIEEAGQLLGNAMAEMTLSANALHHRRVSPPVDDARRTADGADGNVRRW